MARQAKKVMKGNAGTTEGPKSHPKKSGVRKIAVARLGRKPVPENESRHDRFIRLGTKRMNNAIRQIQLLGNLCSPNYECDANDLALMRDAIHRELDAAIARFSPRRRQAGGEAFSFGSDGKDRSGKAQGSVTSH